jgi:transcriptional regulator with XRE-family HTH domain
MRMLPEENVFGKALRRCRQRAGVSQERLALRAGVARTYVGRIERQVLNPTMRTMHRMLKALDVSWNLFSAIVEEELVLVRFPLTTKSRARRAKP